MATEANKALIRRFVEQVINRRDLAAADLLVAPTFVDLAPLPGQGQGRTGLKQWLATYLTAFPDLRWSVEEQVAEGDRVVSRFTWRGTNRGPFLGQPPTGKPVIGSGVVIDRIVDGTLKDRRVLIDGCGMPPGRRSSPAGARAGGGKAEAGEAEGGASW